jgi:hypothetical protein
MEVSVHEQGSQTLDFYRPLSAEVHPKFSLAALDPDDSDSPTRIIDLFTGGWHAIG